MSAIYAEGFDHYPLPEAAANLRFKPTPKVAALQLVAADGTVVMSLALREGENHLHITKDGGALWIRNEAAAPQRQP